MTQIAAVGWQVPAAFGLLLFIGGRIFAVSGDESEFTGRGIWRRPPRWAELVLGSRYWAIRIDRVVTELCGLLICLFGVAGSIWQPQAPSIAHLLVLGGTALPLLAWVATLALVGMLRRGEW